MVSAVMGSVRVSVTVTVVVAILVLFSRLWRVDQARPRFCAAGLRERTQESPDVVVGVVSAGKGPISI